MKKNNKKNSVAQKPISKKPSLAPKINENVIENIIEQEEIPNNDIPIVKESKFNNFLSFFTDSMPQIKNSNSSKITNLSNSILEKSKKRTQKHIFLSFFKNFPSKLTENLLKKTNSLTKAIEINSLNFKNTIKYPKILKKKKKQEDLPPEPQLSKEDIEKNEKTKKEILETEKQKILLEQKLREIDREIENLEKNVIKEEKNEKEIQNKIYLKSLKSEKNFQAEKEALNLVKKMNKLKQEREMSKEKEKNEKEKALLKRLEEEKKTLESRKIEIMNKKQQKIQEKLEQIKKMKEEREIISIESKILINKSKEHYSKVLNHFNQNLQEISNPELEKRKKDLEKRRNIYKPLDHNEIKEHAEQYEKTKQQKEIESKLRIHQELKEKEEKIKKLESNFTKKVIEIDHNIKFLPEKLKEEKLRLIQTKQKYTEIIKEQFKPKINLDKRKQIQDRIAGKSKKKNNESQLSEKLLKSSEKEEENKKLHVNSEFSLLKGRRKQVNYPLPWKSNKTIIFEGNEEKRDIEKEIEANKNSNRYGNYIKEIRRLREEKENSGSKKPQKWEKHLKDNRLDMKEKYLNVLKDADQLEAQAKIKEEMIGKLKKKDINTQDQINDLYLNSIKAKLALLSNQNDNI